jgi:glycine/D-amino acid oxidase-like deaminating enzyme
MRIPELSVDGIRFGILGRRDGTVDPMAIQGSFERAARRLGVEWVPDDVVAVHVEAGRVGGVGTRGGLRIAAPVVVNACGAWAARLGTLAGAPVPVTPVVRQLYRVTPPAPLSERLPMVVDPSGVHFRADEGGTLRVGEGADAGHPLPEGDGDFPYDPARFTAQVLPVLARRVPSLARARLARGWSGLYEVSPDHNAILGEHPDRPGFVLACGFSGHGVMMAPAAGFAIAELIRTGRASTLDIAPFRLSRYAEGAPIHEEAVL